MEQQNAPKLEHHPAVLKKEGTVLVIVDVQEKLLPYVVNRGKVVENVRMLIRFVDIMDIPIVMTEHYPKGLGTTVSEIREVLKECVPIEKVIFSCCGAVDFLKRLESLGAKQLMIVGIESHICVTQTTLDTIHAGYDVHVISDAISSRTQENHEVGIEKMRQFGAVISSTEMAMYEIMERADTPQFKEVLKLVK